MSSSHTVNIIAVLAAIFEVFLCRMHMYNVRVYEDSHDCFIALVVAEKMPPLRRKDALELNLN